MGRFQINVRTDKETSDLFNSQVEQSKLTKIGYVKKMLQDAAQGKTVELLYARLKASQQVIQEKDLQIQQMNDKYNVKPVNTVLYSSRISLELCEILTNLAYENKIPKNQVLEKVLYKQIMPNNVQVPALN